MDWLPHLTSGERLCWSGRPAPRCYTFRNWPHSLFGMVLLLAACAWLLVGRSLAGEGADSLLLWLPYPFVAFSLYLAVGHLLVARLQWERTFFAVTDRRLLLTAGFLRSRIQEISLDELTAMRFVPKGEKVGTVWVVTGPDSPRVVLSCVEHPEELCALLRRAVESGGNDAAEGTQSGLIV